MSTALFNPLRPNTLDRFILKQIVDAFVLGVVVFTLIVFFSDAFLDFMRDIQRLGIPFYISLLMIGLQLPQTVALILPASTFLAVMMVYNTMNNQFELIAMRMNGISLNRLVAPALVLGLFAAAFSYVLGDFVVPYCNKKSEELKAEVLKKGALPFGKSSFTYPDYDDEHNLRKLVFVSSYEGRKLDASTIIDLSDSKVIQIIQAKSGVWYPSHWEFRNASVYSIYRDRDLLSFNHSGLFKVPNLLKSNWKNKPTKTAEKESKDALNLDSGTLSFWELFTRIQKAEALNRTDTILKKKIGNGTYINLWEKVTLPLSCFVLILTAVPLAITPPRAVANRGFIFSLGVLFLFYLLRAVFEAIGRAGTLSLGGLIPLNWSLALACWLPLLLLIILGMLLLSRKSRVL